MLHLERKQQNLMMVPVEVKGKSNRAKGMTKNGIIIISPSRMEGPTGILLGSFGRGRSVIVSAGRTGGFVEGTEL